MTFAAGFLAGWLVGTTAGIVVMAFFCGVSRNNHPSP
jgi:hypothetical protein